MVAVSFVIVLALMSSTVVAQPGTDDSTKLFTESVHRWIPLDERPQLRLLIKTPPILVYPTFFNNSTYNLMNSRRGLASLIVLELPISIALTPESTVEMSSEDAVKAAVDCLGVPFYNAIAPVMEAMRTDNGKILVWKFQLRDNPTTQWIEVKSQCKHW
ncbi:hypothetical protein BSLG_010783 [Batrachochytrium salamandrivorans]|nr:hypothetical protein BSLG_010783 [Batrachochytrium salamandrivorans]